VPSDRLLRILARLKVDEGAEAHSGRLCEVCAEVVDMSGAGIMLMSEDRQQGSICTSDPVSARIEELQYTLGEGPCVDAYQRAQPVLEPDLATAEPGRWSAFTPAAVAAGARAVFGFPMQIGNARLGALNLYRNAPGPMSDEQHRDALMVAGVAARAVISMQAEGPPGELAAELEAGSDFRWVVHQATGMIAVQLDIGVGDALVRLRARAFAEDRPVTDVAKDVVVRRVRFRG
jgi:hypothetical protein